MRDCIEWQGRRNRDGYGRVWFRKNDTDKRNTEGLAHRRAWELMNGPIPTGMFVCHRCDNPSCFNVAHLFLGTPADNTADMMRKRRSISGRKLGQRISVQCENNPASKLTPQLAYEIRAASNFGVEQRAIAKAFGVSLSTVGSVIRGEKWVSV